MTTLSEHFRFYNTEDADAVAGDIASGKTAYVNGGMVTGVSYHPAVMQFDGKSYYSKSVTTSGNKVTVVARFKQASFTGASAYKGLMVAGGPTGKHRPAILLISSDYSTAGRRNRVQVQVQNTAGTLICRLFSINEFMDDQWHTLFFSFDGDTGSATFYIDGANEDDTGNAERTAPTTGTLDSGTTNVELGRLSTSYVSGEIGYFGYADAYLTNLQGFMDSQGNLKRLDDFRWTQWGGGTPELPYQVFNGSTGYFVKSSVTLAASNKFTCVGRFKHPTAGATYQLVQVDNGTYVNTAIEFYADNRMRLTVWNSAGTIICQARVNAAFDDDLWHTFFFTFDGDTGAVSLIVDGVERWESGWVSNINTTGTLPSGGASYITVGRDRGGIQYWDGECSFFGYAQVGGLSWSDFMDATGIPKEIDEVSWAEWGGACPLVWNRYCQLDDNRGSAGNLTRTGTITHTAVAQPLFWHEAGKMDENRGYAGAMTVNGTVRLGKGGII